MNVMRNEQCRTAKIVKKLVISCPRIDTRICRMVALDMRYAALYSKRLSEQLLNPEVEDCPHNLYQLNSKGEGILLMMKQKRHLLRGAWLIVAVLVLALLTACQQPAAVDDDPDDGVAPEEPRGTIVVGMTQEPNLLNPILLSGMEFQDAVIRSMFTPLVRIHPDASLEPMLATTIPTVENGLISEDFLTYTFPLREDALWSDGEPFTAHDVKFSVERILHPDVAPRTLVGYEKIDRVEAPDDHTVVFHLKEIYPPFVATVTMPDIIPKHVWEDVAPGDMMEHPMTLAPEVTLGPYTFKEWDSGNQVTVVRDPNFFLDVGADSIVYRVIPDQNAVLAGLLRGDLHVYWFVPVAHFDMIEDDPDAYMSYSMPPVWWEHIRINNNNPILQDVRVRQALNYGVDKEQLIEVTWAGRGTAYASPIGPASWAHDPDLHPYPHDVDRANELLEEAGWVVGSDGIRERDGERLSFAYSTTAGNPWREQTQRVVQDMWTDIGVEVRIRNVDAATFFGDLLRSDRTGEETGGWDLGEFQSGLNWDPAVTIQTSFHSEGSGNRGRYSNAQIDELVLRVNETAVQEERIPIFHEISSILKEDAPAVWLYITHGGSAARKVEGFHSNPWQTYTWNVNVWTLLD